jgi:hypothetical protein
MLHHISFGIHLLIVQCIDEKDLITLKPERKLWQKVKKFMPEISFTRLENLSSFGTPDLLCYNKKNTFFTVEFPATRTEMKNFMKALAAWSLPLVACGLKLAACRLNLFTKNFETCSLTLVA